jgi:hypothetical protein
MPTNIIGILVVAFFAAKAPGNPPPAMMISTLARTRSAARSGNFSYLPSLRAWRNAASDPQGF